MSYGFWDYFFGWMIVGAFLVPFLGAIAVQVIVFLVAMFGSALGFGSTTGSTGRTVSVRLHHYDEDEDR